MGKLINITDKFTDEKPSIQIGDKLYPVNDSMDAVFKFEELAATGSAGMLKAIENSLGKTAMKSIDVEKLSVANFKVLVIAILAAMQGLDYDEAAVRFQEHIKL